LAGNTGSDGVTLFTLEARRPPYGRERAKNALATGARTP
jgi:hypothetical protein